ncbi:MAG: ABC transporter substrate-binding protein [Candidatus Dormiibacterota bacterium]
MRAAPVLVLVLICLLLGCACSGNLQAPATTRPMPASGGSLTEAVVGPIGTLNPVAATTPNAQDVDALVYQGLTTIDGEQRPVPQLAKSWSVSSNGLVYTVQLREGIRWADGAPFTASDVLFTYRSLQNRTAAAAMAPTWRDTTVVQIGQHEVRFTLKAPSASFPLALRQPIIPAHVFSTISEEAMASDPHSNALAFGTGPFRVASISKDRRTVTLRRNADATPRPYLDSFAFHAYATLADGLAAVGSGSADSLGALQPPDLAPLRQSQNVVVRETGSFTDLGLYFGLTDQNAPVLGSLPVRRAFERAIDREAIIQQVLGSHATEALGPIPPASWAYAPRAAAGAGGGYDPGAAKAALDAAGWKVDPATGLRTMQGRPLTLTLLVTSVYPQLQIATAIVGQLRKIGIDVQVDAVPTATLVSRLVANQYQLALVAIDSGADPDEYATWHSDPAPGTLNFASSYLPRQALMDKDLEDGRAAPTRAARAPIYRDFQSLVAQSVPAVFLCSERYDYVTSRRVGGIQLAPAVDPADRLQGVAGWYVNTKSS